MITGITIQEYLNGKRKNHYKPIAYLLVLTTAYFLISKITSQNTWLSIFLDDFKIGLSSEGPEVKIPDILTWFSNNLTYTTLLLLPVFSLSSYLCFRKFKANYLEHIVINAYITGQQIIFYIFLALIETKINSDLFNFISILIPVSYCIWVFSNFFTNKNKIVNISLSLLTYTLYTIFILLILLIFLKCA